MERDPRQDGPTWLVHAPRLLSYLGDVDAKVRRHGSSGPSRDRQMGGPEERFEVSARRHDDRKPDRRYAAFRDTISCEIRGVEIGMLDLQAVNGDTPALGKGGVASSILAGGTTPPPSIHRLIGQSGSPVTMQDSAEHCRNLHAFPWNTRGVCSQRHL
jgi:hypothetical protein